MVVVFLGSSKELTSLTDPVDLSTSHAGYVLRGSEWLFGVITSPDGTQVLSNYYHGLEPVICF